MKVASYPPQNRGDDSPELRPISLADLWRVVYASRLLVFGVMGAVLLLTAASTLLRPRTYSSELTFFPQVRSESGVGGLAAQLGLSGLQGDPTQSPQFYPELLQTRSILGEVVRQEFSFPSDTGRYRATLITEFGRAGHALPRRTDQAVRTLSRMIAVSVSTRSGMVVLRVTTSDPILSRDVAAALLAEVQEFNTARRQSQARAERQFVEQRLFAARSELRSAENRLGEFLGGNRTFASPSLGIERDRLTRAISEQQSVVSALGQAFEKAKIDEVRDTPVLTVVGPPEVAVDPDPRQLIARLLTALFGGLALGIVVVLLMGYIAGARPSTTGGGAKMTTASFADDPPRSAKGVRA